MLLAMKIYRPQYLAVVCGSTDHIPPLAESVTSGKNCSRKPGCIANVLSAQAGTDIYDRMSQSPATAAQAWRHIGELTIEMTPPVIPLSYLHTKGDRASAQRCNVHAILLVHSGRVTTLAKRLARCTHPKRAPPLAATMHATMTYVVTSPAYSFPESPVGIAPPEQTVRTSVSCLAALCDS